MSAAACAAATILLAPSVATAADGGKPVDVTMTGTAEAPGPGDPDGMGTAEFRINPGKHRVCYTLTVSGLGPVTASHIHIAPVGVPGPVVVPLDPPTTGTSSGCADVTRELALDLIRNPTAYYVNVHTTEFPAGAIRAQLG